MPVVQTTLLPVGWGGTCGADMHQELKAGREHKKEQIKGMLTLLQFLHILPKELGLGIWSR